MNSISDENINCIQTTLENIKCKLKSFQNRLKDETKRAFTLRGKTKTYPLNKTTQNNTPQQKHRKESVI